MWLTSLSIANIDNGVRSEPPYKARPQWTRSSALVAIEPAAPAAVTTEVKGTIAVPSERSMAGRSVPGPVKR